MTIKRDVILLLGGRLVTALISLIALRVVTTFLSPEQYGELALLLTVQMFCGLFLVNPVGQYINLHTHTWWDDGTLFSRLKSYRNYILWVSVFGGLASVIISAQYSADEWVFVFIAMLATVAAGTWNATLIPMLNMLGFRGSSVLLSIVTVSVGLLSSIFLVFWLPSSIAWFSGQVVGMTFGFFGAKYVLRKHLSHSKCLQERLPLLSIDTARNYCLPLAVATGFMWLQLSGYRFVIERFWGLAQLGFMAIGLQLAGQIFAIVESLATQFFYPLFYKRVSKYENLESVQSAFSDLLNTLVPVYFVITGLLIFSASYLLKVLVSSQFGNGVLFVMLGAIIELCRVLGNLLSNAAQIKRETITLTLPYALGAFITSGLIWLAGVQHKPLIWAGVSLVLGSIVMLTVMIITMHQKLSFSLDIRRFFVSVILMLTLSILPILLPQAVDLRMTIKMLLVSSLIAIIVVFALLWKNPATLRLINVTLREN